MKKLISLREIAERIPWTNGTAEVCAAAEGTYDRQSHQLALELDAYVVPVHHENPGQKLRPTWLPQTQVVRLGVGPEEASDAARDIFFDHVKHVRQAAPSPTLI